MQPLPHAPDKRVAEEQGRGPGVQCLRSVSALTREGAATDVEEKQDHSAGEALSQHTLESSGSDVTFVHLLSQSLTLCPSTVFHNLSAIFQISLYMVSEYLNDLRSELPTNQKALDILVVRYFCLR
jgi:hypothetical protein